MILLVIFIFTMNQFYTPVVYIYPSIYFNNLTFYYLIINVCHIAEFLTIVYLNLKLKHKFLCK